MKFLAIAIAVASASVPFTTVAAVEPLTKSRTDRPLRYRPVDGGFEIENGPDSFNRPLYGGNTAFRVDAGDKPQFSTYLPGKGGVLRVGVMAGGHALWLHQADQIYARYAGGTMTYRVRDASLPGLTFHLQLAALRESEGLAITVEVEGEGAKADVFLAFGGASGQRARRDGDIGTESVSVSEYFTPKPDDSRGNRVQIGRDSFKLEAKVGQWRGTSGWDVQTTIADARHWEDPAALVASAGKETDLPLVLIRRSITAGSWVNLALQQVARPATTAPSTTQAVVERSPPPLIERGSVGLALSEARRQASLAASRVSVDTPDAFINSAVPALCLAADALRDPSGTVMHGGVAWRRPYLGWRGPYAFDAIGDHGYTRSHLEYYFKRQSTKPPVATQPAADESEGLARSHRQIKTEGNLIDHHYDMNLVAVDTFFRHLLWTGDLDYARAQWPVIKRHLAWEKRLFRREFGPEKLPLYEAYACIWASDDLQYSGGGVAHSTAFNYFHNLMAARVAKLLGEDPAPYEAEAKLIRRGMEQLLWLPKQGWFAECKDWLGNQLVHPAPALWTHYHTIDSQVPDAMQAWQMCKYVDTQIPHIPVRGQGVPAGLYTLPSTTWMPYTWSINNVAMAEVTHTALADWQAGRPDAAYSIFKGAIVDSMFQSQCPGNVQMTSFFDVYRQEAQRDSGDPVGITWRALIEGLFGIRPDALAGELTIDPGFPTDWNRAAISHPNIALKYTGGNDQRFTIEPKFDKPMRLKLRVAVRNENINRVTVNGKPAEYRVMDERIGDPHVEVTAPAAAKWDVLVSTDGDALRTAPLAPAIAATGQPIEIGTAADQLLAFKDSQGVVKDPVIKGRTLSGTAGDSVDAGTLFLQVKQGNLTWWQPVSVDLRPPLTVTETAYDPATRKASFRLINNTRNDLNDKATVELNGTSKTVTVRAESLATSGKITFDAPAISPGANRLTVTFPGQPALLADLVSTAPAARKLDWQTVDLSSVFNDQVTQMFKNKYVAPRSPFASLAMPVQGFGGWATNKTTPKIDDTGLRAAGPVLTLPTGGPVATPADADAKNIAFVSQWDNYPRDLTLPLTGRATQATLLMAGSTNAMQSRIENGEVIFTYADGTADRLALRNPETWWPIEQDFLVDEYGFNIAGPLPMRVDLKTGRVRQPTRSDLGKSARTLDGGAATVLSMPLDPKKELKSITVRAIANEVVIGLMGLTLERPTESK